MIPITVMVAFILTILNPEIIFRCEVIIGWTWGSISTNQKNGESEHGIFQFTMFTAD